MGILHDLLEYWPRLAEGLWISIQLALLAYVIGIPGGLVFAVATMARSRLIRTTAVVLVEIGRGVPALVVLQIVYFGLPINLGGFLAAGIAFGLTTAAYTSEIIRGGLQAVPKGELEAAQALGMKYATTLRDVIVPQGMRIALPALVSFCVLMFQATTLAFTIAVPELMAVTRSISSQTFQFFNMFVIAGVMYGVITISASLAVERLERNLAKHV